MTGTGGVMADVTRWEMRYPISVHGENPWGPLPSPDGGWVTAADHLAALERVRVETLREARAAVLGPLMHDDACCSRGCTQQHWTEWDSRQRGLAVLGLPVADLSTRPESRCDESCNCTAAPFAAAIDRLINAATTGDTDD